MGSEGNFECYVIERFKVVEIYYCRRNGEERIGKGGLFGYVGGYIVCFIWGVRFW